MYENGVQNNVMQPPKFNSPPSSVKSTKTAAFKHTASVASSTRPTPLQLNKNNFLGSELNDNGAKEQIFKTGNYFKGTSFSGLNQEPIITPLSARNQTPLSVLFNTNQVSA